jgi:hypothetical protein
VFEFRDSHLLDRYSNTWATLPALLCDRFVFQDRLSQTICPDWLPTMILLISASWLTRITGMSHLCPACHSYFSNRVLAFVQGWFQTMILLPLTPKDMGL